MNLFDRFTRAIERNSRDNERRNLVAELDQLFIDRDYIEHRIPQAIERLATLREADQEATYGKPAAPKRPIIEIVEDDATPAHHWHGYKHKDCGVPDGLVGEWRAPV